VFSDINANVCLWYGVEDNNVSIKLARRIASEISNCESTFIDKEGHFSVTGNYLKEILNEIKTKTNGTYHWLWPMQVMAIARNVRQNCPYLTN